MTAGDAEAGKKLGTAPVGPPPDLVRGRGQEPAEAPQGNLSSSHLVTDSASPVADQGFIPTDLRLQALLTHCLSEPRLHHFAAAATEAGVAREDLYLWNCDLAAAFHLPLHMAEVTCRNSIHSALLFKGPDWHNDATFLKLMDPQRRSDLERAVADETAQHGDRFTTHHLVSSLTFGFWEHMTTKRFERFLFPRGIQKNFKGAPWKMTLEDLRLLIEGVRRWRNRVVHHNALFSKHPTAKYQDALDLISWTSPDLSDWVSKKCQVNQVINNRPRKI